MTVEYDRSSYPKYILLEDVMDNYKKLVQQKLRTRKLSFAYQSDHLEYNLIVKDQGVNVYRFTF